MAALATAGQLVNGRVMPEGPAHLYRTWQVIAPLSTHWDKLSCAAYECPFMAAGWVSLVSAGSQEEHAIRVSGRSFTEERTEDGLIRFAFSAGQPCFLNGFHRAPNGRPERLIERGGDWRGNPARFTREHRTPEDWRDSLGEHLDRLRTTVERG